MDNSNPKLLDQCREVLRMRHYSIRTEQAYVSWIERYILFFDKRHPAEMGEDETRAFLADLAVNRNVAASTQTVALSALIFLCRNVLKKELPFIDNIERAKKPVRIPEVFTQSEVQEILSRLQGTYFVIAVLLYGAGLRLMEAVRLRVKDIDFEMNQITVRDGKGEKDRVTMLPQTIKTQQQDHLFRFQKPHQDDLRTGFGKFYLPYALERKYPNARRACQKSRVF